MAMSVGGFVPDCNMFKLSNNGLPWSIVLSWFWVDECMKRLAYEWGERYNRGFKGHWDIKKAHIESPVKSNEKKKTLGLLTLPQNKA